MKFMLCPLVLAIIPAVASSADPCQRVPFDPEVPAGLEGAYELIGRDAMTGKPYLGNLQVSLGKNSYLLKRTVRGTVVSGEAWFEGCGADRVKSLFVTYRTSPVTQQVCYLSRNFDNDVQATCKSDQGKTQGRGLESWFQKHG